MKRAVDYDTLLNAPTDDAMNAVDFRRHLADFDHFVPIRSVFPIEQFRRFH